MRQACCRGPQQPLGGGGLELEASQGPSHSRLMLSLLQRQERSPALHFLDEGLLQPEASGEGSGLGPTRASRAGLAAGSSRGSGAGFLDASWEWLWCQLGFQLGGQPQLSKGRRRLPPHSAVSQEGREVLPDV